MSPRIQGRSISRSIASPRSNITAFLDVTVNGVRVVVTLMLRPGILGVVSAMVLNPLRGLSKVASVPLTFKSVTQRSLRQMELFNVHLESFSFNTPSFSCIVA